MSQIKTFTLQRDLLVGEITGHEKDYQHVAETKGTEIDILNESHGTLCVRFPNYSSETFPYDNVFFVSTNMIQGYK